MDVVSNKVVLPPICVSQWLCLSNLFTYCYISAPSAWAGSYGHSWMCKTIKSHLARNIVGHSPHQELQDYLAAPLEDVDDGGLLMGCK